MVGNACLCLAPPTATILVGHRSGGNDACLTGTRHSPAPCTYQSCRVSADCPGQTAKDQPATTPIESHKNAAGTHQGPLQAARAPSPYVPPGIPLQCPIGQHGSIALCPTFPPANTPLPRYRPPLLTPAFRILDRLASEGVSGRIPGSRPRGGPGSRETGAIRATCNHKNAFMVAGQIIR